MISTKYGEIIKEDNRYVTWRNSKHFMVKYNGFGISMTELKRLYQENVKEIIIRYKTSKGTIKIYKSRLWNWLHSTKEYNDNGDAQKFLGLTEMYYAGEEVVRTK